MNPSHSSEPKRRSASSYSLAIIITTIPIFVLLFMVFAPDVTRLLGMNPPPQFLKVATIYMRCLNETDITPAQAEETLSSSLKASCDGQLQCMIHTDELAKQQSTSQCSKNAITEWHIGFYCMATENEKNLSHELAHHITLYQGQKARLSCDIPIPTDKNGALGS